jgi:UDP-2,3-diacylglucosamine hydrolase
VMRRTLFISDLHLSADHPDSLAAFERFCATLAPDIEALYILGDLFEYWAGDDDLADPFHAGVIRQLKSLSGKGLRIHLMHGNRDLLMGDALARAAGATLLEDPTLLDLYGTPTLISHGDMLCTDDTEYQMFRARVRSKEFQKEFLARTLPERKAYIQDLRRQSAEAKKGKDSAIMDVNDEAVTTLLRKYRYPRLIHGHTHRPAVHEHVVDGHRCERWVLSDWEKKPQALACDAQGCRSVSA